MKKIVLLLFLFIAFSCKNTNEEKSEVEPNDTAPVESNDEKADLESDINRYDNIDNLEETVDTSKTNSSAGEISGRYTKQGELDEGCNCYCIEVSLTGNSEFCLQPDRIYINVRFEKTAGGYDAFYVSPSSRNKNKDLPWEDFSKEEPIANLKATNNGLELDWLGFQIDGQIATDYAIFGKKTLEGNFTKN